jgi:anti-sigma B factor antagonist
MTVVRHPTKSSPVGFELAVVGADPLRATVRASGELDLAARDSIVEVLGRQRDSGRAIVRLDLTDVTFMDCSCLRALVEEHQRFLAARGQLVLTGVGNRTNRLLKLTGLDQILFAVSGPPDLDETESDAQIARDPQTMCQEPLTTDLDILMVIACAQSTAETRDPRELPAQSITPKSAVSP